MTRDSLLLLLDYHYWARDRMLESVSALPQSDYVRPLGGSFASIRDTVVHLYSAEWIWMERWKGISPTKALDVEAFPDAASVSVAWRTLEQTVRAYVDGLEGDRAGERIRYRNLAGKEGESSRWSMIQHVVNHASYHRGQITTLVRQVGGQAAGQDLIAYYRENGI